MKKLFVVSIVLLAGCAGQRGERLDCEDYDLPMQHYWQCVQARELVIMRKLLEQSFVEMQLDIVESTSHVCA